MSTTDTVERVVAPVLSDLGIELVDVESRPGHLVVTIDRSVGLDLAAISQATSAVSQALDAADAVPGGRYELEVTSPGLERRLRKPEHFAAFVGSTIALRLRPGTGDGGPRRLQGVLLSAGDHAVSVQPDDGSEAREALYQDIERAHTVFDWRAALAEAPSPSERADRRSSKPTAADRSRAAVSRRAVSGDGHATGAHAGGRRKTTTTSDDDRDVTENP